MNNIAGRRRLLIGVFGVWVIIIGLLVWFGVSGGDGTTPRYAGEDVLVSASGAAVSGGADDADEPDPADVLDASSETDVLSTDAPGDARSHRNGSRVADDKGRSPDEVSDLRETERVMSTETPRASEVPRVSHRPRVSEAPRETVKPRETDRPEPTPATYHFSIECKRILDRPELWRDGLEEILPTDGVFYNGVRTWHKNETVYEALEDICTEKNILLDSRYTPIYETYYVSGIGNLYEFDCGSESGWKYSVNGVLPGVGSSRYIIRKGDSVVFFYDYEI